MSIADSGGFDAVLEVSPTLASQIFRAGPVITAPPLPFSTASATGTARIRLSQRQVAFSTGLTIELNLSLTGSSIDVEAAPGFPSVPPGLRTVDIDGSVVIVDRVDAVGLSALVDTAPDAARGTPSVTVTLDERSILASPLISILLATAWINGGEAGMTAARQLLITTIRDALTDGIRTELAARPVRQTLFTAPTRFAPATAPLPTPATVSPVAVATGRTVQVGIQLGGARGDLSRITRSALRPSLSGDVDGLAIVISGASLLRDFVRPTFGNLVGLPASGFLASDPFLWTGATTVTLTGAPPLRITLATMTINESQQLVLTLAFSVSTAAGAATVSAVVSVPIAVTVATAGGTITLTLAPLRPTVLSSRVDIAWWVYLLSAISLGTVGVAILALADAIADGAIGGPIETAIMGALTATSVVIPAPAGLPTLNVTSQRLFQPDAPGRPLPVPLGPALPAATLGRIHDLIVTFAA